MDSYFRGTGFSDKEDCESELFYSPVVCQQCDSSWYLKCEKGYHPSSDCKRCIRNPPRQRQTLRLSWLIIIAVVFLIVGALIYKFFFEEEQITTNLITTTIIGDPIEGDSLATLQKLSQGGGDEYYI